MPAAPATPPPADGSPCPILFAISVNNPLSSNAPAIVRYETLGPPVAAFNHPTAYDPTSDPSAPKLLISAIGQAGRRQGTPSPPFGGFYRFAAAPIQTSRYSPTISAAVGTRGLFAGLPDASACSAISAIFPLQAASSIP